MIFHQSYMAQHLKRQIQDCKQIIKKFQKYHPKIYPQFNNSQILFPFHIFITQTMGCENSTASSVELPIHEQPIPAAAQQHFSRSQFGLAEKIGDTMFKEGNIQMAIKIYKKIIEDNYIFDYQIEGLGNSEHSVSRYEWFRSRWYEQNKLSGKLKGNPYDALSLCYCQLKVSNKKQLQKGIVWYEEMLGELQSYSLYMGYANILFNLDRFDQAIKIYNKVIQLKPTLVNAYVCIALTYQFRRINKQKSVGMANKILSLYPENEYALFILARNEANVDQKIKKLKDIFSKNPQYVRAANQIGISYGKLNDHPQAINWYKKCIEIAPRYTSAFNNVGVRNELLKDYEQALIWYIKAIQLDGAYQAAFKNLSDVIDTLSLSDEKVYEEIQKYKIEKYNFCHLLGKAYYNKKKYDICIKWYNEALKVKSPEYLFFNSLGIYYDEIKDYQKSQKYYLQSVKLNPKYQQTYYNLGILYKQKGEQQKAISFYCKSIQVNPRYTWPYNNLANIYKDLGDFPKAIENYKKAIQYNQTYILAIANLGTCYLALRKYGLAFDAIQRARTLYLDDSNQLHIQNKAFLKGLFQKFEKEGQSWKDNGEVNFSQISGLLKQYLTSQKTQDSIAYKPEIIKLVNLISKDKFELTSLQQIYETIKVLYPQDQDYFHIIPLMFIQYFQQSLLIKKKSTKEINEELVHKLNDLLIKESGGDISPTKTHQIAIKMKHFNPTQPKVNLAKGTISTYESLCSQISSINNGVEKSLSQFIDLVEDVRKRSNGIQFIARMRIPRYQIQQFRHRFSIMSKIFQDSLNTDRCAGIMKNMEEELQKEGKKCSVKDAIKKIQGVWAKEISNILSENAKDKKKLQIGIYDLIKGRVTFKSVEDLSKAIEVTDNLCFLRGYDVIGLENRLSNRQTKDVILTIKVKEAICQFRLTLRHAQEKQQILKAVRELKSNMLGCSAASYVFMSRSISYPLADICSEIQEQLGPSENQEDKKSVEASQFIMSILSQNK